MNDPLIMTKKQMEVLTMIHPDVGAMSQEDIAEELGISREAVRQRLKGIYKNNPGLQEHIERRKKANSLSRESLRRPMRFNDLENLNSDIHGNEFLNGHKVVRKF